MAASAILTYPDFIKLLFLVPVITIIISIIVDGENAIMV